MHNLTNSVPSFFVWDSLTCGFERGVLGDKKKFPLFPYSFCFHPPSFGVDRGMFPLPCTGQEIKCENEQILAEFVLSDKTGLK